MMSRSSIFSPTVLMRTLRAKITSFVGAAPWSWPSATEPVLSTAANKKAAPIAPAIEGRTLNRNHFIVVSPLRVNRGTSGIGSAVLPRGWSRLRAFTCPGLPEDEDRHRLEFLGLELVIKRRHDAATPFDDRLADRGAVRAPEIRTSPGQVRRSERIDAGPAVIVAVEAIAFGVVVEQHLAAGRLGAVGLLTADLEDVFDDLVDLGVGEEFVRSEVFGVFLGAKFGIESQHVHFRSARVLMPRADSVTDGPFDIGGQLLQSAGFEIVT